MKLANLVLLSVLAGCASNTGPVPIGSGRYMLSRMQWAAWSGGAVKADLYREAEAFCAMSGKKMDAGRSNSADATVISYASAEIEFTCN